MGLETLSVDDLLRRQDEPRRKKRRLDVVEVGSTLDTTREGSWVESEKDDLESDSGEGFSGGRNENNDSDDDGSVEDDFKDDTYDQVAETNSSTYSRVPSTSSRIPELSRVKKVIDTDAIRKRNQLPTFEELGTSKALIASLAAMSIRTPTEVQAACIPPLLSGSPNIF